MDPVLPQPSRLRDGSDVLINGTRYRLNVLAGDDTGLFRSSDTDALATTDVRCFESALVVLRELAQIVTRLNERLLDPIDGTTNRAVEALLEAPQTSESFKDALRPWAFALFKHGCNIHSERGCVIVPPCPRPEFEREIQKFPAQARGQIRWKDFLDHVFCPVPLVTQGFYLFDRPDDRVRFEEHLGPAYWDVRKTLGRIFEEAIADPSAVPNRQWKRFDALSQQALGIQKDAIGSALEVSDLNVRGMATRVRIRCYEGGVFRFLLRHYSYAFSTELDRCATLLDRARVCLPQLATEAREVLADLADWCRTRTDDDHWGECLTSWLKASDPDSRLDINFTTEEKVSRLGAKGCFQLAVTAIETVPEQLLPVFDLVRTGKKRHRLNVLWLRHLLVGGGSSNTILAGEKLPDPDGRPLYKVMTFTNAVRASMVQANAELICAATHFEPEDVEGLGDTANLLVLLHETGHTLGDFAGFLGDCAASVEETNAEASIIYLAKRYSPQSLADVVGLAACWTPVHRAMQGPTEPHSHSNIVLFDELHRAGGIACDASGRHPIVRPDSIDAAVNAAFALAMRMRLWEAGAPVERHDSWMEPFDVADAEQDGRIMQRAREAIDRLEPEERDSWQHQVRRECRAFFSPERLQQLAVPLAEVVENLPKYQTITVIPTDDRFRLVVDMHT